MRLCPNIEVVPSAICAIIKNILYSIPEDGPTVPEDLRAVGVADLFVQVLHNVHVPAEKSVQVNWKDFGGLDSGKRFVVREPTGGEVPAGFSGTCEILKITVITDNRSRILNLT